MNRLAALARRFADAALQLTLPLFDAAPASTPAPEPAPGPARPDPARDGAIRRAIVLGTRRVPYALRRSRRRTIGFTVTERGLAVAAPKWVAIAEIESALLERGGWIVRKIDEFDELVARREREAIRWEHGGRVPYLGRSLELRVDPAHAGDPAFDAGALTLTLALPRGADAGQVRDRAKAWLQSRARALFEERVEHFATQLGVRPTRLGISSARTRWGSCGADGAIRLNWRLIHVPEHVVDYVVCHELAHLRELNHGPRFWRTVGELFPEHQNARRWLREHHEPGD